VYLGCFNVFRSVVKVLLGSSGWLLGSFLLPNSNMSFVVPGYMWVVAKALLCSVAMSSF